MEKRCRKCNKVLSIDEFYKHEQMADGHLNICKECVKSRVAKHREAHVERIREYDRQRGKTIQRQAISTSVTRRRRSEVAGYQKGHDDVNRAVRNGEIVKANVCQVCGKACKTEGHHPNYANSKTVIWLCPACHKQYHLGKTERADFVRGAIDNIIEVLKKDAS